MGRETTRTDTLAVQIPMTPPAVCTPNKRTRRVGTDATGKPVSKAIHWREKHRATKTFKEAAYYATYNRLPTIDQPAFQRAERLAYRAVIAWEKGRQRLDPDNATASLKGAIDGVCLALGVNDKRLVTYDPVA